MPAPAPNSDHQHTFERMRDNKTLPAKMSRQSHDARREAAICMLSSTSFTSTAPAVCILFAEGKPEIEEGGRAETSVQMKWRQKDCFQLLRAHVKIHY